MNKRPNFNDINSFEEFSKYYWYQKELSMICKSLNLKNKGTKQELNNIIKEYFNGNYIKNNIIKKTNTTINYCDNITIDTPLLSCGFSLNKKFREYFSNLTGISPFKFNADMATALRKVKNENNTTFTIKDLLDVYYGNSNYAKYDKSVCQWNQFLKDFCNDPISLNYSNKLKAASILWKKVKNSSSEKIYTRKLLENNLDKLDKLKK